MTNFKENNLILEHRFDPRSNRHFLNGVVSVYHCHHYTTLYTQLALDSTETELLQGVAEETFFKILNSYFKKYDITYIYEKFELACKYYAAVGLGKMEVVFAGELSGQVKLLKSHVDEGWIKKWGKYDKPVNYIGAGFIGAMFAAVFNTPIKSFRVIEWESIVMGAEQSVFNVAKK